MHLLIAHYHLNRGGVTRVVETHLRALATQPADAHPEQVVVAHGGRTAGWNADLADELPFPVTMAEIPELDYDNGAITSIEGLRSAVEDLLSRYEFDPQSTVFHAHNHSLGKNSAVCPLLIGLAQDGWRMLLQIHDFAEDLRPGNYQHLLAQVGSADELHRQLYPQAPHLHYATLNGRDARILRNAGVAPARLHGLPNAVGTPKTATVEEISAARRKLAQFHDVSPDRAFVLYPVRAIRRKNLGELLLWSLLLENTSFGVTLAPLNPLEQPSYQAWVELAGALRLPVVFGCGAELTLEENFAAADAIISTSVAEGFGLVFLEAPLAGRPLFGRSLKGVTDDFQDAGMTFPGLGPQFWIPTGWLDIGALREKHLRLARSLRESFGFAGFDEALLAADVERVFASDKVDFAVLDSQAQQGVIRRVAENADLRLVLRDLNPILSAFERRGELWDDERRAANRGVIERHYSLPVTGARLHAIYQSVLNSPIGDLDPQPAIARSVLNQFALSGEISPIRLES